MPRFARFFEPTRSVYARWPLLIPAIALGAIQRAQGRSLVGAAQPIEGNPDKRVQDALQLVFTKFAELQRSLLAS